MIRNLIAALVVAMLAAFAAPAKAYTDCTNTLSQIYTGDAGAVQIAVAVGPSAYLYSTDPNLKTVLMASIAALMLHKTVVMRFTASGVSCSTTVIRSDLNGIYINY